MEKLKEYAAMAAAMVAIIMGTGALGVWVLNAQVIPEFNRLDGRVDNYETLYTAIKGRLDRMDKRLERRFDRIDNKFEQIDDRFKQIDDRFKQIDDRFKQIDDRFKQIDDRFLQIEGRFVRMENRINEMDSRINKRFDEMAANMKVILSRLSAPVDQGS